MNVVLRKVLQNSYVKPVLWLLCLAPCVWLVWGATNDQLGPNPAEYVIRATGDWTLRLLTLTMIVTPMRIGFGLPELAKLRRMLGLFTYFYVWLHLLSYSWLDMGLEWVDIVADIAKRPFILVGFSSFVLLTALALTSFKSSIRWLGAMRWQWLHRFVYVVVVLAILHFFWMRASKHNYSEVIIYASILFFLLAWRLFRSALWRHCLRWFGFSR